MNDNQNKDLNNEPIAITPITPQSIDNTQELDTVEEQSNIVPITPVNENNSSTEQPTTQENNAAQVENNPIQGQIEPQNNNSNVITPNIIIPEMKEDNNIKKDVEVPNQVADNNSIPQTNSELSIESSSPFDIGISTTPTSQEQVISPTTSETQNSIPVNNSIDNDINIQQETVNNTEEISLATYLINMFLFSIPLIGLIVLIIKITDKKHKNISNFAKAYLIYMIIIVIIILLLPILFGSVIYKIFFFNKFF